MSEFISIIFIIVLFFGINYGLKKGLQALDNHEKNNC